MDVEDEFVNIDKTISRVRRDILIDPKSTMNMVYFLYKNDENIKRKLVLMKFHQIKNFRLFQIFLWFAVFRRILRLEDYGFTTGIFKGLEAAPLLELSIHATHTAGRQLLKKFESEDLYIIKFIKLCLTMSGLGCLSVNYIFCKESIKRNKASEATDILNILEVFRPYIENIPVSEVKTARSQRDLEELIEVYEDIRHDAAQHVNDDWFQNQNDLPDSWLCRFPMRLLENMFSYSNGPNYGIMIGEQRATPIGYADRYMDFAYDMAHPSNYVTFSALKQRYISLYDIFFAATVLCRQDIRGNESEFFKLAMKSDDFQTHSTDLSLTKESFFTVTTRDLVNAERALWLKHSLDSNVENVLEIGGGYGGFAKTLIDAGIATNYVICDLPPNIILTTRFLEAFFPGQISIAGYREVPNAKITLCTPWLLESLDVDIDLLVNCLSFQHMSNRNLSHYDSIIQSFGPQHFFSENFQDRRIIEGLDYTLRANGLSVRQNFTRCHRPQNVIRSYWSS